MPRAHTRDVFVNCPFSDDYRPLFDAIVFTIQACGFRPRCALENDNGAEVRIEKIMGIIKDCPFGVHDISYMEIDAATGLPRLNMAFELGAFLGARWLGTKSQRAKSALILDRDRYRFQAAISDIAGQDIQSHAGEKHIIVQRVRDWLRANASDPAAVPGGAAVARRFASFENALPELRIAADLPAGNLGFLDFSQLVARWLRDTA